MGSSGTRVTRGDIVIDFKNLLERGWGDGGERRYRGKVIQYITLLSWYQTEVLGQGNTTQTKCISLLSGSRQPTIEHAYMHCRKHDIEMERLLEVDVELYWIIG